MEAQAGLSPNQESLLELRRRGGHRGRLDGYAYDRGA